MENTAYIKLVPSSARTNITTEEVQDLFKLYQEISAKTGKQLDWGYEEATFPYEIVEKDEAKGKWFYLKSNIINYNMIVIAVDSEIIKDEDKGEREQTFIQISLLETSTYGDKSKANEFCKFFAKTLQGELHLFNGRIMYYYPRK